MVSGTCVAPPEQYAWVGEIEYEMILTEPSSPAPPLLLPEPPPVPCVVVADGVVLGALGVGYGVAAVGVDP